MFGHLRCTRRVVPAKGIQTLAVVVMALTGCHAEPLVCASTANPGIALTVLDATSRRNLEAEALVSVSRLHPPFETYDNLRPREVGSYSEPAGRYVLRTSAPQYVARVDTVTVKTDDSPCQFTILQRIEIALSRAP